MAKIKVFPNRDDLPPHPIDGKLPAEGGEWTADQYTFRLIRDGDITEVPPDEGGGAGIQQPDGGVGDPEPKHGGDDPPKRKK